MVPFQTFATADGWIIVACPKQSLWEQLCAAIGRPELAGDERFADFAARDRNRDVLARRCSSRVFAPRTTAEWLEHAGRAGVPSAPGERRRGRARRPAGRRARRVVEYEHPTLGVGPRRRRRPFRLDGRRAAAGSRRAGRCSASTPRAVLRELCGYDEERLASARRRRRRSAASSSSARSRLTDQWRGRFLEDFAVGDVYRSRLGRTVSEVDNTWFTLLTMNTNQMHFNAPYAARTEFGQPLVVSTLTLAIVLGLSVADTSENAVGESRLGRHQAAEARLRRATRSGPSPRS